MCQKGVSVGMKSSVQLQSKYIIYMMASGLFAASHRYFKLLAHGSGSILDLFSFRSDPYKSRVDAIDMDPIQSSADMKRVFLLSTENLCIS